MVVDVFDYMTQRQREPYRLMVGTNQIISSERLSEIEDAEGERQSSQHNIEICREWLRLDLCSHQIRYFVEE